MRTKNQFRRLWAFVSFFVLSVAMAVAATMATVEGQVVDQTGEPIIGASVLVKGTTNGTITDFDGNFVIQNVDNNATLVVSYVGYITQEVKVTRGKMKIVLKEDSKTLEELVVTGYATQAKKDITGSVAVVSRDALTEVPVATFAEALQGKAAGVQVTKNDGAPGGGFRIRVRGGSSLQRGVDPLYIIDGIPTEVHNQYIEGGADLFYMFSGDISASATSEAYTRTLNALAGLNPNDIESIDVLKDAASAAIYGARAANGVILVTTKQGKAGKVELTYNGSVGWSNAYKRPQLLDAQQYLTIMDEYSFNTSGSKMNYEGFVPEEIINKVKGVNRVCYDISSKPPSTIEWE